MSVRRLPLIACAVSSHLLLWSPALGQGADLYSDRTVQALVEETLIADLMLRSCPWLTFSETGRAELEIVADELASRAGHSPESAAAQLSSPQTRERVRAGALRRLALMGAQPDDAGAICALADRLVGGPGVIGALLVRGPETE